MVEEYFPHLKQCQANDFLHGLRRLVRLSMEATHHYKTNTQDQQRVADG